MPKRISRFQQWLEQAKVLLDEAGPKIAQASRWRRFVHFWVLVWSSFNRNRCPVRASALAYASLLALIPMLAVVISITSSILKQQGEDRINEFIGKTVVIKMGGSTMDSDQTVLEDVAMLKKLGAAPGVPAPLAQA